MINKQRYGIRKYKIGAASIALGTMVVIGVNENNEAHASEIQMQHSSNESSESNVQNNVVPQQNAPVETLKETHVDTNQQLNDEQIQQPIQQNEESVQSEEIAERTETIIQETNSNTSKQEVDNNKKVVIPEPETTIEINQPNAVTAPKVNSVDKIRSSNNLQRTALYVNKDAGKDVSEKVEVIKKTITTKDKSKKVNPHQAGRITVDYELIIGDDIKKDDYFDIKFSENVDTNGVGSYKEMPEIKDGGHVIATGIRMSNGDVRYKFTEYVIGTEYVKVKLSINLFFKTSVVLKGSKQKVTSTIGDNSIDNEFDVEYLKEKKDKNMSIKGNIDKLDKENGNITHVTSVNTDSKNLSHVVITGKLSVGEVSKNNIPKITIYEYTGSGALSESGYFNEKDSNFKDVTALVNAANVISLNENGSFTIFIQSLNSKPYIIKYEAKYDIKSQNLNFQTQMCINYDLNWLTLNNEVEFYKNSASGAGKFIPIIDGGRVVDITTDSPIIVKGENNVDFEFEIEETIVESITGNNNDGILEIIEDSKPDVITGENSTDEIIEIEDSKPDITAGDNNHEDIEIIEDSKPITISGESNYDEIEVTEDTIQIDSKDDTLDEVYNNNHIVETDDLSDITGGEINQNNNVVVIEDVTDPTGGKIDYNSDHVELDENSNPGGGRIDYNSDHIDLEENSNPGGGKIDYNSISVDLEEDSNPGGGKVDYNTNIIDIDEDSNFGEEDIYHNTDIIDFDEDTATGVVTGAISDHTTIEDTMEYTKDNNLIELVDDNTLPPAITGEAEGPIIEIDENHKVEIIDITMPIGEEGRIKGKIEETTENNLINYEEETGSGEIRGEITDVIEEIDENHQIEIIDITMPIGEEGNVNGTVEETVENNVIDFDTESGSGTIHGNITGIVEEIDDNHVIDIEHGLDSENGSIDINDIVEDTMIDKPSIDNRTENPVIIVENTIPKNNGSVKGIIEELDITKVVSPVIVQKDKKNMPQETKNENVGVEKKARIGNVASQKNKDLIIKDERKIKYNTNSQGCDSGRACVVNVKPNFEPISTVPHTSNDSETQLETLPNTGQNNNEQAVVFGGLLSLLGLSLLRRKGKKTIE
ncbi:fibrinogen-binding adhesin SdrG C-terminal domain-containing protein [Staphylococcus agnetis]|uniref:fibrinogen-binding adhesin SdrG C-terminal domain-containing protein n=1 Tax=Staphylococcus agnetis TaxID=985762 RepID=UPI00208F4587|nr:fibrinogen-binding adhesin SdrG C-terminal domain-containing protein [Staphylococcus agnetis]MCO4345997.1 fibrinogen-binding adhesin SdrG C-terminal domain-containing protein [Staphylococcus agnetis]MCO4355521.1 fibrinogen-binding adhesin SdrG C-terminal domain-containing protein [Staphylococcus agnetis]MCO4360263.1 fibrinogen-binding adhesin SdrG C-terminal domain-containing protein [Staphylococcus agnetis]MCO4372007.1 fibrinogen-binding adhesin SdrG C-terminal domain-containing protein [St